jgi:DNA-binding transcriptional MerR regulator
MAVRVISEFTAADVMRLTGVPYQTLNYWAKIGLVRPTVRDAAGSGSRRVYNFPDLVAIRVALKLRQAGIFGKSLVRILQVLREAGFESPAEVAILLRPDGEVIIEPSRGKKISGRKHPGQLLLDFSCDCADVSAEVEQLMLHQSTAQSKSVATTRRPSKPAIRASGTAKRNIA